MNPHISVCIPVYNVENYIDACLNSVLNQSFQNFEIIIVNDASPDKAIDRVKIYANNDSRIHIYENPKNMGLMWTRKEGYIRAKGDYVVFLDSDDTLPLDALENLYAAIHDTEYDIVCGQISYITSQGTSIDKYPNKLDYGTDAESAIRSTLRWEITHNLCGKIYKRQILQSFNYDTYVDVVNAEDAILFYQILSNVDKITTIHKCVYNYYLYDSSSTNVILGEKALRGIFLWQKKRYTIIYNAYPLLLQDLYISMLTYLVSLSPSLENSGLINKYLQSYDIPLRLNFFNIIKYVPNNKVLKSLVSYYFPKFVQKYRYYMLQKGSVKN